MSAFTIQELTAIKEERNLSTQQLLALQNAANTYAGKVTKQELLDSFRRLGYMV